MDLQHATGQNNVLSAERDAEEKFLLNLLSSMRPRVLANLRANKIHQASSTSVHGVWDIDSPETAFEPAENAYRAISGK